MKKTVKQDIREDKFVETLGRAWNVVAPHATLIAAVVVVAALVLSGIALWSYFGGEAGDTAWARLAAASTVEEIEALAVDARGTDAEPTILLQLGLYYLGKNEPDNLGVSEQHLRDLIALEPSAFVLSRARLALGKALQAQERYREAITEYDTIASAEELSYLKPEALWHAGRCYELLGETEQARQSYERVGARTLAGYSAQWATLAEFRLTKLAGADMTLEPAGVESAEL